jgi:hypothetical protein
MVTSTKGAFVFSSTVFVWKVWNNLHIELICRSQPAESCWLGASTIRFAAIRLVTQPDATSQISKKPKRQCPELPRVAILGRQRCLRNRPLCPVEPPAGPLPSQALAASAHGAAEPTGSLIFGPTLYRPAAREESANSKTAGPCVLQPPQTT